jgi:hypothetical protein
MFKNDIQAPHLTEVGFFAHHLVCHETAECQKWLSHVLPEDTPKFQQEITTIWGGPSNRRQGTGVLKIYADLPHVNKLSEIFRSAFTNENETENTPDDSDDSYEDNDEHTTTFIPKDYFNTLSPQKKARIIRTQSEYLKKYRTVLISGIKSIHLPTTVMSDDNLLSIKEWIETIPDLQHRTLFLHVQEVNSNEIELKCLATNLPIAKKWARNAKYHIAKNYSQYNSLPPSPNMKISSKSQTPLKNGTHRHHQLSNSCQLPLKHGKTLFQKPSPGKNQRQSSQKSPPKSSKNKQNTRKVLQTDDNQTITTVNAQAS